MVETSAKEGGDLRYSQRQVIYDSCIMIDHMALTFPPKVALGRSHKQTSHVDFLHWSLGSGAEKHSRRSIRTFFPLIILHACFLMLSNFNQVKSHHLPPE